MRIWILPIYWFLGALLALALGVVPHPHTMRDPNLYAIDTVRSVLILMTVQTALLMTIYRPRSFNASWGRGLLGLLVCLPFLVMAALGSMHSQAAWGGYMLWVLALFFSAFALLVTAIGSARAPRH
jgi:uncharacterized MnhB-related membrane protein